MRLPLRAALRGPRVRNRRFTRESIGASNCPRGGQSAYQSDRGSASENRASLVRKWAVRSAVRGICTRIRTPKRTAARTPSWVILMAAGTGGCMLLPRGD